MAKLDMLNDSNALVAMSIGAYDISVCLLHRTMAKVRPGSATLACVADMSSHLPGNRAEVMVLVLKYRNPTAAASIGLASSHASYRGHGSGPEMVRQLLLQGCHLLSSQGDACATCTVWHNYALLHSLCICLPQCVTACLAMQAHRLWYTSAFLATHSICLRCKCGCS